MSNAAETADAAARAIAAPPGAGTESGAGDAQHSGPPAAAGAVTSAAGPDKALRDLQFAVEKSMRYHQRRRGFMEAAHRWTMFGVILSGTSAVATGFPAVSAFVAALLGAIDLAFGFSHKARTHESLYRRFAELNAAISATVAPAPDDIRRLKIAREKIEADEPPVYWLIEADCDNEITVAWGLDKTAGLIPLKPWQIWSMNFWRADSLSLPGRTVKA